jgi:hypothetical protein
MMLLSVSLPGRTEQRDGLAFVAPVDAEISIHSDQRMMRIQFAHANQAKIREISVLVRIAFREFMYFLAVFAEIKRYLQHSRGNQGWYGIAGCQMECRFRNYGLTSEQWRFDLTRYVDRPGVMLVRAILEANMKPVSAIPFMNANSPYEKTDF